MASTALDRDLGSAIHFRWQCVLDNVCVATVVCAAPGFTLFGPSFFGVRKSAGRASVGFVEMRNDQSAKPEGDDKSKAHLQERA